MSASSNMASSSRSNHEHNMLAPGNSKWLTGLVPVLIMFQGLMAVVTKRLDRLPELETLWVQYVFTPSDVRKEFLCVIGKKGSHFSVNMGVFMTPRGGLETVPDKWLDPQFYFPYITRLKQLSAHQEKYLPE